MKKSTNLGGYFLSTGVAFILAMLWHKRGEKDPKNYVQKPFDPNAGVPVGVEKASKLTKKYRKSYPENIRANYCNKVIIEDILNHSECVGLRVYRAQDERGVHGIVVVGVDEKGKDLTESMQEFGSEQVLMAESYEKCPHNCDKESSLYRE